MSSYVQDLKLSAARATELAEHLSAVGHSKGPQFTSKALRATAGIRTCAAVADGVQRRLGRLLVDPDDLNAHASIVERIRLTAALADVARFDRFNKTIERSQHGS